MKKNTPKFLLVYKCGSCGLDSGFSDLAKEIKCYYCGDSSNMKLIQKSVITPEVVAERIRLLTERLYSNMNQAYSNLREEERNFICEDGNDVEKNFLLLLEKIKEAKEFVDSPWFGKKPS